MHFSFVKRVFRRKKHEKDQLPREGKQHLQLPLQQESHDVPSSSSSEYQQRHSSSAASPEDTAETSFTLSSKWMFRVRPKFLSNRVRRQKSLTSESSRSAHSTPPARQAVQKFLEGPSQSIGRDDAYQEECKELLRKLSAKGNRVPGFV